MFEFIQEAVDKGIIPVIILFSGMIYLVIVHILQSLGVLRKPEYKKSITKHHFSEKRALSFLLIIFTSGIFYNFDKRYYINFLIIFAALYTVDFMVHIFSLKIKKLPAYNLQEVIAVRFLAVVTFVVIAWAIYLL